MPQKNHSQLPGLPACLFMKQELFQAISYCACTKTAYQPWPKHPYFALVSLCSVQLVLPQCLIFQNLPQNTPMETSASRDVLWHSHREPASSAHRSQTPNLISKLQNQLPDFPGVMGKNRKDHVGVEAERGSTLKNIHVFQLCNLTTVKKDLLKKKSCQHVHQNPHCSFPSHFDGTEIKLKTGNSKQ